MKTLLFAPEAMNLSETARTLEIAKACRGIFNIHFMAYGGLFEPLIEEEGFELHKLTPRLTPEKMDHLNKVTKGEKAAIAFTEQELLDRIESELNLYETLKPCGLVTGYCVSTQLSARIKGLPVVWTSQSTCLAESFLQGRCVSSSFPRWIKKVLGRIVCQILITHSNLVFLNLANRILRSRECEPYETIFELWQGSAATLLLEPREFSNLSDTPPKHHYVGPLTAHLNKPVPPEIRNLRPEGPIVYLSMGSTAKESIVLDLIREFGKTKYTVIATVNWYLRDNQIPIPPNIIVTDLIPAHVVNKLADISVIHGGNGTVMNAALAGKPVVGVGMQFEQVSNLECLVAKGSAIRISKTFFSARRLVRAVDKLLDEETAKQKATELKEILERYDGPKQAADVLQSLFDPR